MVHTERMLIDQPSDKMPRVLDKVHPITSAVTFGASSIAQTIGAKLVVVVSRTGETAWVKSKQRNFIPTLGISNRPETLRRMCLFWGIMPHHLENVDDTQELYNEISRWGKDHNMLSPSDSVVFVTGTGIIDNTHNQIVVHEVRS